MRDFFKSLFQKIDEVIRKEILLSVFFFGGFVGGLATVIAGDLFGFCLVFLTFAISVLIFLRGMKKFDKTIRESYYMFKELEEDN